MPNTNDVVLPRESTPEAFMRRWISQSPDAARAAIALLLPGDTLNVTDGVLGATSVFTCEQTHEILRALLKEGPEWAPILQTIQEPSGRIQTSETKESTQ
jgi:hypothetical protein